MTSVLNHSVTLELVRALVDAVAGKHGIRVMFIKGNTLEDQGLRDARLSADVDALVHPTDFAPMLAALRELGWDDRGLIDAPIVNGLHAETLIHEKWGCDIDLHNSISGVFTDPAEAFEILWARRVSATAANIAVWVPDPVAHACIAALHCLRTPTVDRAVNELPMVVAGLRSMQPDPRSDLLALATALHARTTLKPLFDELGVDASPIDISPDELRAWMLRTSSSTSRTAGWIELVRSEPWRRKPRVLWRAIWLTEAELRTERPSLPAGKRAIFDLRVARLRTAFKALPDIARGYRRARQLAREQQAAK